MSTKLSIKDWTLIVFGILLLLSAIASVILFNKYRDAEHEVVIWNDSTHYYQNKYGEEYLAKNTYILKAEELQEYNDSLYAEYKSLKDHPVVITKTKYVTTIDTITTHIDSIFNNGDYTTWDWSANDSIWYSVEGSSSLDLSGDAPVATTVINELKVNNEITMDVIDDGKQLEVIAKSNNPYTNVNEIQSVVIDPTTSKTLSNYYKPKRWGFGPFAGVGIYGGYGYGGNPASSGLQVGGGFVLGFAVHYDLIQW